MMHVYNGILKSEGLYHIPGILGFTVRVLGMDGVESGFGS